MDSSILYSAPPDHQPGSGPWSPAALTRRALSDLAATAEAMHSRRRPPHEIGHALFRQASLHREGGAALPADTVLSVVRQLPGLASYDPVADWRERWADTDPGALAEGIDATGDDERREWGRRALLLATWLRDHAGTASAEAAVRAVERDICDLAEGK